MSIDYTILGVLIEGPSHGYSIKKYLLENVSKDFGINDGQLYPALARLEDRGWIRKRVIHQRRSPTKHQYRATPAGEEAFLLWLEQQEGSAESPRYDFFWKHDFLQRLTFFRPVSAEGKGILQESGAWSQRARVRRSSSSRSLGPGRPSSSGGTERGLLSGLYFFYPVLWPSFSHPMELAALGPGLQESRSQGACPVCLRLLSPMVRPGSN